MSPLTDLTRQLKGLTRTEQAPTTHSGTIVALRVPATDAPYIAVPNGEPENELHVTLAYLGETQSITPEQVGGWQEYMQLLAKLAKNASPLRLHTLATGRFENADEDEDACYLAVDGDGLRELREHVMELADECGLEPSRKHPEFSPHITLAYVPHGDPHPEPDAPRMQLDIPDLELWIGGVRALFPLGRENVMSKADQSQPQPAPKAPSMDDARALYAQLTGDLIQCHRQDRQTRERVAQLAAHHGQAAEKLGAAIRAPRGSAVEQAFLEHAAEANTARRLGSL